MKEVALFKSQGYFKNKRSIDSANSVLMIDLSYLKSKRLRSFLQKLGLNYNLPRDAVTVQRVYNFYVYVNKMIRRKQSERRESQLSNKGIAST